MSGDEIELAGNSESSWMMVLIVGRVRKDSLLPTDDKTPPNEVCATILWSFNGRTPACQVGGEGSIPSRSTKYKPRKDEYAKESSR